MTLPSTSTSTSTSKKTVTPFLLTLSSSINCHRQDYHHGDYLNSAWIEADNEEGVEPVEVRAKGGSKVLMMSMLKIRVTMLMPMLRTIMTKIKASIFTFESFPRPKASLFSSASVRCKINFGGKTTFSLISMSPLS